MRIYEKLDDLDLSDPKQVVRFVRPTGEVEILTPIASGEVPLKRAAAAGAPHGLSTYHRSLAISGAFTVIALILGTGFHFLLFGPPLAQEEVTLSEVAMLDDIQTAPEEPVESDLLPDVSSPTAFFEELSAARPIARRSPARPRAYRSGYRARRSLPHPQYLISEFVPTTLVIYVESGEIKTRTEPQSARFKRS